MQLVPSLLFFGWKWSLALCSLDAAGHQCNISFEWLQINFQKISQIWKKLEFVIIWSLDSLKFDHRFIHKINFSWHSAFNYNFCPNFARLRQNEVYNRELQVENMKPLVAKYFFRGTLGDQGCQIDLQFLSDFLTICRFFFSEISLQIILNKLGRFFK